MSNFDFAPIQTPIVDQKPMKLLPFQWKQWFVALVQTLNENSITGSQPAHRFLAGPASGAGTPTFRAIQTGDLPGLSATIVTAKITSGGANGSMTFTNGLLTAQTPAT